VRAGPHPRGAPDAQASRGQWYGALPVTPGALHAALTGARLSVRSPIPRDQAFISVVDRERRLAGYSLELQPDGDGASASLELAPELLGRATREALFAVVSSEPDKRSPSAVGWPLQPGSAQPALTFDVADQLLVDGTDSVLQRERQGRLQRRQIAAALFALVGSLMLGAFAHEVRKPRSASRVHASDLTTELVLLPQRWWIGLALACLLGGIAALTYFGLLQR
jgi:hypothetical protein